MYMSTDHIVALEFMGFVLMPSENEYKYELVSMNN